MDSVGKFLVDSRFLISDFASIISTIDVLSFANRFASRYRNMVVELIVEQTALIDTVAGEEKNCYTVLFSNTTLHEMFLGRNFVESVGPGIRVCDASIIPGTSSCYIRFHLLKAKLFEENVY